MEHEPIRCDWVSLDDIYIDYHDKEWGVPVYDDRLLFEMLILEGAQAGLNWLTILKKRQSYREAFDYFDAEKIANYDEKKRVELLSNPGIIRNKLKVNATIGNAQAFLKVVEEYGSFSQYIWQFVDGTPIQHHYNHIDEVPATSVESELMSKTLKKRGFKFVGATICYAYMQGIGMVNDHTTDCWRHEMVKSLS